MSSLFNYEAWDVLDRVLVLKPALAVPAWEYLKRVGGAGGVGLFVPTIVINAIREHVDKAHSDGGVPIYGVECSHVRNVEGAGDVEADVAEADVAEADVVEADVVEADVAENDYPREEDD